VGLRLGGKAYRALLTSSPFLVQSEVSTPGFLHTRSGPAGAIETSGVGGEMPVARRHSQRDVPKPIMWRSDLTLLSWVTGGYFHSTHRSRVIADGRGLQGGPARAGQSNVAGKCLEPLARIFSTVGASQTRNNSSLEIELLAKSMPPGERDDGNSEFVR
jgi:hypothetical protein